MAQLNKRQVRNIWRAMAILCGFAVIWLYAPKFFDSDTSKLILLGFALVMIWVGYFANRKKRDKN